MTLDHQEAGELFEACKAASSRPSKARLAEKTLEDLIDQLRDAEAGRAGDEEFPAARAGEDLDMGALGARMAALKPDLDGLRSQ